MRWFPRNLFHLLFRMGLTTTNEKNTRKKREAKRKKWCSSLTSPWYLFYAISNWIIIRFYFLSRTTKKTRNQFGYENMFDRTGSDMMVRYSRATTKKIIKIVFADVKKKESGAKQTASEIIRIGRPIREECARKWKWKNVISFEWKKSFRFSINGRIANCRRCFFGICCKQRAVIVIPFSTFFFVLSAVLYLWLKWKFLILTRRQLGSLQTTYGQRMK